MTAKPYDPTLKTLVEIEPESWPALFGYAKAPTEIIDADIATVSGAADKVLRVTGNPTYLLHLEFVSGHDSATLPSTLLMRSSLLGHRHQMLVRSGAVLLRPEADSPQLTGVYERCFPDEEAYHTFRYAAVRVWQLAPEPLLSGGLALLPLAWSQGSTAALGSGVHLAGIALFAGAGGATISRSNVHERIFDVSGHSGRGTTGRTR